MRWLVVLALAACEPAKSMLDDRPGDGTIECSVVVDRIRASYTDAERASFAQNPKLARWFDATQRVIREACEQDHWPEAIKQCAIEAKPGQLAGCNQQMSPELQQKTQARMLAAMQGL